MKTLILIISLSGNQSAAVHSVVVATNLDPAECQKMAASLKSEKSRGFATTQFTDAVCV